VNMNMGGENANHVLGNTRPEGPLQGNTIRTIEFREEKSLDAAMDSRRIRGSQADRGSGNLL